MMELAKAFEKAGHPFYGSIKEMLLTQVPRPSQIEDLGNALGTQRYALYSDAGTGKSLIAFMYILYRLLSGKRVVAVMPPTLIPQFMYELMDKIVGHHFWMQNLSMPKAKREKMLAEMRATGKLPDVLLMSYIMFVKHHQEFIDLGYSVLIADESHMACNPKTKNFRALKCFLRETDGNFLSMTATPTPTELRSAYGQIALKTPGVYKSLREFDAKHVIWHQFTDFPKIEGYKDIEVLQKNLNMYAVRRRKREVLDLKDLTVTEQRIELAPAHMALYRKLLRELIIEMGDEIIDGTNPSKLRVLALQLITGVEAYTETKVDNVPLAMLKIIQESLNGGKLLVFVHFRATVQRLAEEFKHLNPALMYGGSNVPENVEKFNKDPSCRIAFLNYRSGGAGLNLQYCCHNTVFYENTGSPAEYEQAVGRTDRGGQTEPCNVWIFRYTGTISERLINSALGRSKDIKVVMRDKRAILDSLGV